MAEIFGAVASGAGLVSLSMQLLESAQKLKGFYDSARDAPSTVSRLSSEMETMSLLLRQFEGFRRNKIFGDRVLDSCIKSCEEAVSKIKDSVGKVERLLLAPKTRTLGKTYMGFKEPEIRKLLEEMEHAKSSVLLAFSSYQHYHSILRDARHEDLLRQQFATQNERFHSLERVVASGHLALLERVQILQSQQLLEAPKPQQLVHAARPIEPQRLALALNDNKRHKTFNGRQKRAWLCKFRVSLPPWLVSRVWEFGLREAEGGWTAQLYPIMVRPVDTYVFSFVYSGDVDTVRRLLRSGQLSVRDHSSNWDGPTNLLQVGVWCSLLQLHSADSSRLAASCGQVELCRFLLQESGFFHDDKILLGAFAGHARYVGWNSRDKTWSEKRQLVERFYHLFVSKNNMDVDFEDGHPYGSSLVPFTDDWKLLLTVSSARDILNGQSADFDSLPFEQRFSTVMKSPGWPAEIFLSIFRHDKPASLVTAAIENGTTALHWAAAHLGEWAMRALQDRSNGDCSDVVKSYQRLVKAIIRMGANLHAIHQVRADVFSPMYPDLVDADSFVSFLRGLGDARFDQKHVASAVRLWGQTITESGYSLKDYADAENLYLADLRYTFFHSGRQNYTPVSVAVNDGSILQIKMVNIQFIKVWRACPTKIPGAWPVQSDLPSTIIWNPEEEDIIDGFQWVKTKTVELESTPRFAQPAQETDVAYSVKEELRELRAKWFNGVQDDHGPLAMMAARASTSNSHAHRQHVRRRSASAPPPGFFEHAVYLEQDRQAWGPGSRRWVASVTKCPFDGQWGACSTLQWRRCMRGDLHITPEAGTDTTFPCLWDWHYTWERSFLLDEGRAATAERFAERFRPEQLHMAQATMRRAEEKKAFNLEEEVHRRHK